MGYKVPKQKELMEGCVWFVGRLKVKEYLCIDYYNSLKLKWKGKNVGNKGRTMGFKICQMARIYFHDIRIAIKYFTGILP